MTTDGGAPGGAPYELFVPPSPKLLDDALRHARTIYRERSFTSEDVARWTSINPYVVGGLTAGGEYRGYFDIVPLSAEGAEHLRIAREGERALGGPDVCPPAAMRSCAGLYFASLVVDRFGTADGRANARALFYGVARFLELTYGPEVRTIWGLAATPDGVRVLERFGARLVQPASDRGDGLPLYEGRLAASELRASIEQRPGGPPRVTLRISEAQ